VQGLDGKWRALDLRVLHAMAVSASETYNTGIEDELRARLGVEFAPRESGRRRHDHRADGRHPVAYDTVTTCRNCGAGFAPTGRQTWCSSACRVAAWRRRHTPAAPQPPLPPKGRRRPVTVYECDACGERSLGSQRCDACNRWMRAVGIGGTCPACVLTELPGVF